MLKDILNHHHRLYVLVFILFVIVTFLGIHLDLIVPDAALYGSISKTIATTNDFVNLYALGNDWLDKPHFPFWITAVSYKIFGVTNFAYKIPAIFIFFLGLLLTFKFAKNNYSTKTAVLATIVLATATHSVISNFDVRAEPYLTTFIIGSIYFLDAYLKHKKIKYFIFACLFAAFAIMTKGMFVLIPILAAGFGELLIKRNWKQILNPIWLFAALLVFVFIIPELYTLYVQFDMHPEKTVFNRTNVSGLHFFFWESQFGRFFNTAPMKGSGDPFFFLHTLIWAFLPWGILFYIASFFKIKRNLKKIKNEEFYSLCGAIAAILIFSLSKFQLPHYTNIIFPFMAILVADFIVKLETHYQKLQKTYRFVLWFQNCVGVFAVAYLFVVLKPSPNYYFYLFIFLALIIVLLIYKSTLIKTIKLGLISSVCFLCMYSFLFTHFYPVILKYQGDISAARYVNVNYNGNAGILDTKSPYFGFELYVNNTLKFINTNEIKNHKGLVVYVDKNEFLFLKKHSVNFKIVKEIEHFHISKLNGKFLNKETRSKQLEKRFLIEIQ